MFCTFHAMVESLSAYGWKSARALFLQTLMRLAPTTMSYHRNYVLSFSLIIPLEVVVMNKKCDQRMQQSMKVFTNNMNIVPNCITMNHIHLFSNLRAEGRFWENMHCAQASARKLWIGNSNNRWTIFKTFISGSLSIETCRWSVRFYVCCSHTI